MIKVVVLGLVCVVGVGAIAAATSNPAAVPIPSVVYPVVAGNKSDRLSLVSIQNIQPTVDQVTLVDTPPSRQPTANPPPQTEAAKAKPPAFIPRHWHDPNDTQANAKKLKPELSRNTSRDASTIKLADAQGCRADGVSSLLRKLSLQPACSR